MWRLCNELQFHAEGTRRVHKWKRLHILNNFLGKAVPQHIMEAQGGTRWGWVVSVMPRLCFTPRERTPCTQWTGGWVGPRAGLDSEVRGKILCLCWGSNLDCLVDHSTAKHYTDWATPPPNVFLLITLLIWITHTVKITTSKNQTGPFESSHQHSSDQISGTKGPPTAKLGDNLKVKVLLFLCM
jgi:hypothetical protein